MKPPLRTKTLGTKVSEEEFAQLEAAASERGLTLSEWCRETLLASVNGQEEKLLLIRSLSFLRLANALCRAHPTLTRSSRSPAPSPTSARAPA